MKLFVWEDVLNDFTPGIVFAFANSEEEAIELIQKKDALAWGVLKELSDEVEARIVSQPEAFILWGGS